MPAAIALVRELYEAYQRRDWSGAAELLHVDATLDMPATRERLTGRGDLIEYWITVGGEQPPPGRAPKY